MRQPGAPAGELIECPRKESRFFPGTERKVWVYIPAQYTDEEPANLLVVQDGWYYLDPNSEIRFAVVLDNLIHKGEVPVTIAVFVDPGEFPSEEDPTTRRNRNLEYDTYSDAYARLLLEEILPPILRDYRITDDPGRCPTCQHGLRRPRLRIFPRRARTDYLFDVHAFCSVERSRP